MIIVTTDEEGRAQHHPPRTDILGGHIDQEVGLRCLTEDVKADLPPIRDVLAVVPYMNLGVVHLSLIVTPLELQNAI